ncbi:MAG: hypothetical protein HZC44_10735 [Geobacter sp.]|nr:hypothetical protein [Geobacter sp.]
MLIRYLAIFVSALLLAGCSSFQVIPEPVANGIVNDKEKSQTINRDNISITVRSGDAEILSYNLEGSVASFRVVVDNQTDHEVAIGNDSFLLKDNDGTQYSSLTPGMVKDIVAKNTYYLIPYPYVGFYYLEDYERASFQNRFTTDRPYFYELYPQDIYTKALPVGVIIPKAKVAGLLYFRIDLQGKKEVSLLFYKKGTSKSAPADFVFPFKIVK